MSKDMNETTVKAVNEKNSIIVKIDELVKQNVAQGVIRKYLGYMNAQGVLELLGIATLEANPRRPTINRATEAIRETLDKTPELMSCKSKGLLISCSVVEELERNRLRLSFDSENRNLEDVLDGGHNLFAISTFLIEELLSEDEPLLKKAKKIANWKDLKDFWAENRDIVINALHNGGQRFTFMVPVEILTVQNIYEETLEAFTRCIYDICQARNNNVQLAYLASGNQKGVFNVVKDSLPEYLQNLVAWTSGEPDKPVKGEYVLAIVTLILNVAKKNGKMPTLLDAFNIAPTSFYSGRGKCASVMQDVLEKYEEMKDKNPNDEEVNAFASSLILLGDMPRIWDTIELNFPKLYNKFGGKAGKSGAYGRLRPFAAKTGAGKCATLKKDTPCRFHTPDCVVAKGGYPTLDGYAAPLMYSITAFMEWNEEKGCVVWSKPVDSIIDFYSNVSDNAPIAPTMEQLGEFIVSAVHGDPQALGKATYAYNAILTSVQAALSAI